MQSTAAQTLLYVYAIGKAEPFRGVDTQGANPIDGAIEVRLIEEGELAAVVSPVPREVYSQEPLADLVMNADWVGARGLEHQALVARFAASAATVPLRFGTIFTDESGVREMLAAKSDALHRLLDRIAGAEEWSVLVRADQARLASYLEASAPDLLANIQEIEKASPGQAYLLRKKHEATRTLYISDTKRSLAREILDALADVSRADRPLKVRKDPDSTAGEVLARGGYLVAVESLGEFKDKAAQLASTHEAKGISIELVGPWPPYSFSSLEEQEP